MPLKALRFFAMIWIMLAPAPCPLAHAADMPILVLATWNNRSMARQLCEIEGYRKELPPDVAAACSNDPTAGYLDFEGKLITQFAADPKCKGIRVLTVIPLDKLDSYWDLRISYYPGKSAQPWQLFFPNFLERAKRNDMLALQGEGGEQKIAADVCSKLTEQGAKLN